MKLQIKYHSLRAIFGAGLVSGGIISAADAEPLSFAWFAGVSIAAAGWLIILDSFYVPAADCSP